MDSQHPQASERRFVHRVVAWSCVIAAIIVAVVLFAHSYAPQLRLFRISMLLSSGQVDEALAQIDSLDASSVDADSVGSLRYQAALILERQGRTDDALAIFASLTDFANASERAKGIQYTKAAALESSGQLEEAAQAYYLLGDYADSPQRYADCMSILHPTVTPSPTPDPTTAPTPTPIVSATFAVVPRAQTATPQPVLTPAPTTVAEALQAGREAAPYGVLAVGERHTVGVCADGTVVATGSNEFGQCDVSGWTRAVQVAAGAAHTVALLDDGSVLATGDNTYGQCDVSAWRGVTQIAANAYDTFGLLQDGTIVHCGYHPYEEISAWHSIRKISAGSYGMLAIYDGGVLATHPSLQLSGFICDAGVSRGYSVGLQEDGAVVSSGVSLPDWTQIVSVSCGENAVLALDVTGTVHACFFRSSETAQPDAISQRVIALAAGSTHYALLLEDGTVTCFGNNSNGQCNVSEWSLRTTR